ncbi:MAG: hypothetical protein IKM21_04865 [Oscillospiraceae bacterium]|nr:hypothetical protein [Oscillospiraceae bacterium]
METEKKAFRKAFMGGFSKKDVNRYIAEAAAKSNSELEELKSLLEAERKEKDSLSAELSSAKAELSSLAEAKAELDSLKEKYEVVLRSLAEKEEAERRLAGENAELSARVSSLSRTEAEYTARKTELAEIEISARNRAADHIAETERELSSKRAAFESEMATRERHFAEVRARSIQSASDSVGQLTRLVNSLRDEVEGMDTRLTRLTDTAHSSVSTLLNAVSDAETKISDIDDVLSSFDK